MQSIIQWLISQLPVAWLIAALSRRLKSERRAGTVSRGLSETTIDPCLEQRNALAAAAVELDAAIALVQIRAEALIACEELHSTPGVSSERLEALDLMDSLSLYMQEF